MAARLRAGILRADIVALATFAAPLAACAPPAPSAAAPSAAPRAAAWFREEARERGIEFVHTSGHRRRHLLPEIVAGGCALFDMDGDGDLDAFLVDGGDLADAKRPPGDRLFENRGGGRFGDVTAQSGVALGAPGYGMGVACGDADGDGDTDLYVTRAGSDRLLVNDGRGRFTDGTAAAGFGATEGLATSAAFLDYDRDGDLDLFVCHYVRWSLAVERDCDVGPGGVDYCSPKSYGLPAASTLWRNDGGGRFADASRETGVSGAVGNGLGVTAADFDGDGRPDVFVANDGTENHLWLQKEPGRFTEQAAAWGCATDRDGTAKAGMGVAPGDVDLDGDLDLLVVNLVGEGDSLYRNEGRHFSDRTVAAGLAQETRPFTRFGAGFADFDRDGVLDLYVANGRVMRSPEPADPSDPYAEPDQVFRGRGGVQDMFREVLPRGATQTPLLGTGRGAAFGDVDGDGSVDVLVVNRDGPAHLLMNVAPPEGGFAVLRCVERTGADALGAQVRTAAVGRPFVRDVRAAYSYCSSSDPRIHAGLGPDARLPKVVVRWQDGEEELFGDLAANAVHELRRGRGETVRRMGR